MKKLEKRIFYLEKEKKELKQNEKRYNRLKNWGLAAITLGFLSLSVPIYDLVYNIDQNTPGMVYDIYQMFGLGMLTIGAIPLGRGLDGKKYYRNELKKICNFYSYIPKENKK